MTCFSTSKRLGIRLITVFGACSLMACSPPVSEIDLDAAKSRVEAAKGRLAKLEAELKFLQGEVRALTSFSGPEHDARMKRAEALRGEKAELESIRTEVEGKVSKFVADAKAHREALAKEKP